MARMPDAKWLGEHGTRRMAEYAIVCVHTIVGYAPAHAAHFSTNAEGEIFQSRDTRFRSAANLEGNYRIIAIENEDHGPAFGRWSGDNVPPLTDAQVWANARILAFVHRKHGVPLQVAANSKPGSRGLAYHRQGIDGNWAGYDYGGRVSGGETWTLARGKVCPGDRRIAQIPIILARAKQIIAGTGPGAGAVTEDWFDMATEQDLKNAVADVLKNSASYLEDRAANGAAAAARDSVTFRDAIAGLLAKSWVDTKVRRSVSGKVEHISVLQELADAKSEALRLRAETAAILTAVKNIPGVDGEKLDKTVAAAVKRVSAKAE